MILNCVIIDDEPLARKGLKEYIQEIDFLRLAGDFDSALKAMEIMSSQQVDILFLDIQMPKITGIEFLKSLAQPPLVICTTAYSEYAIEGFELNVLDYLLKPISFDRFLKAAMKAKSRAEQLGKTIAPPAQSPESSYFFVKTDNRHLKLFHDDVLFVEALQNYIAIHTKDNKILVYVTLGGIEKQLPTDQFIKVHKSFIVSIQKISAVEGNEIIIDRHRIPISRDLKGEIMSRVVESKLLKR